MILDSSVLAHIALGEPGWEDSLRWLSRQPHLRLSAASLVESHAVLNTRSRRPLRYSLNDLLTLLEVEVVAFSAEQAELARDAYSRYGKGQGHPAQLNFGDVLVYALCASAGEVLAFVGDDFNHTDLETVRLPLN